MDQARVVKALFFLPSLGGGGAESHTLRVINNLDRRRVRPMVAVARRGGSYEAFLDPAIPIQSVSYDRINSSAARLLLGAPGLRRLMEQERPDVLCSVMDSTNLVAIATLATMRNAPKHVLCVQSPPTIDLATSRFGRSVLLPAAKATYRRADRIIALSNGVRGDLLRLDRGLGDKIRVIYNACVDNRVLDTARDALVEMPDASGPVIVAAGRLTYQKGYPTLIDAFARVRQNLDAELWILGDGPDRAKIGQHIGRLGLGSSVRLLGFQKNPYAFMRRADLFVLSSVYEGFGNVIVEAMACGAAVVSTDCPHGPAEIIEHEVNGLLVPVGDAQKMASSMVRVIDDATLRTRLAEAGKRRALAFRSQDVASSYAEMFESVAWTR